MATIKLDTQIGDALTLAVMAAHSPDTTVSYSRWSTRLYVHAACAVHTNIFNEATALGDWPKHVVSDIVWHNAPPEIARYKVCWHCNLSLTGPHKLLFLKSF